MSEFVDPFAESGAEPIGLGAVVGGEGQLPPESAPALSARDRALKEEDPGVMRSKNSTREDWVAMGRRHGEDEADRRGETGEEKENRARRAMGYWAWEWDGKPAGDGERYRLEFGYGTEGELVGVLRGGPDPKHGKDKP